MIASIGDSANHASIALHRKHGFQQVGVLKNCGWKLGQWRDLVLMDKDLGPGHGSAPTAA
jgi:phosphinothricin acetyltransferase